MGRKTKVEAEKTREQIMANALTLFVKKGYDNTTFNDIAARMKMTKGAIYWHFKSKVALFETLIAEMMLKFQQRLDELMPKDELSFKTVADMMVTNAEMIVQNRRDAALFLLTKRINWGVEELTKTRERLLSVNQNGPYHAIIRAVNNDIAKGRVRSDVSAVAVATVCIAIWDGLVRSKIEQFLQCDLADTLDKTYAAMWNSIKIASV